MLYFILFSNFIRISFSNQVDQNEDISSFEIISRLEYPSKDFILLAKIMEKYEDRSKPSYHKKPDVNQIEVDMHRMSLDHITHNEKIQSLIHLELKELLLRLPIDYIQGYDAVVSIFLIYYIQKENFDPSDAYSKYRQSNQNNANDSYIFQI